VLKNILVSALVALTITGGGLYLYDNLYAQKVYYVDIHGFMKDVSKAYVEKKITKSEMKAHVARYASWLKTQPKNRVVFALDDVVSGGKRLEWEENR